MAFAERYINPLTDFDPYEESVNAYRYIANAIKTGES